MVNFDYVIVGAGAAGNTQAPAMAVAWIAAGLFAEDS